MDEPLSHRRVALVGGGGGTLAMALRSIPTVNGDGRPTLIQDVVELDPCVRALENISFINRKLITFLPQLEY